MDKSNEIPQRDFNKIVTEYSDTNFAAAKMIGASFGYNLRNAEVLKLRSDLADAKALVKKLWHRDIHTGYDGLFDDETKEYYWKQFCNQNNFLT